MKTAHAGKWIAGWLLLPLALAGCRREPLASAGAASAAVAAGDFSVTGLQAERSGSHLHLIVQLQIKNPAAAPLVLAPPGVQLRAGKDRAVSPFIAPGLEPDLVAAGTESATVTHWWLAPEDLSGELTMEIGGAVAVIKNAGAFDAAALPEQQAAELTFPEWKRRAAR